MVIDIALFFVLSQILEYHNLLKRIDAWEIVKVLN